MKKLFAILLVASGYWLVAPQLVNAQACPADQVQCDGECQAPDGNQGDSCTSQGKVGTIDACGECTNLQCPPGQVDCSGSCQAPAAQCPANSNRVYNQCTGCGSCANGFTDCNPGVGFNCQAATNAACQSPATWDACTQTCTENYVRVSPTAPQSGFISMQGDLHSGGDVYLNNGRAIRIDLANGASELNIGNWASGGAGANVFVWGNLSVGGPEFLRNLTVSGNLTVDGTINGLNLANAVLTTNTYANPDFITNLAWKKLTAFPAACPVGQFVTTIGGTLTCAAPPAPPPGGITAETDPVFGDWYNNGNVNGNLTVTGCFGPLFRELASTPANGSAGGYGGANAQCGAGQHVCTADEILNTINCGAIPQGASGTGWISSGPPGHTSTGNDCNGWKNTVGFLGRTWDFANNSGAMMPCDSEARFACCQ